MSSVTRRRFMTLAGMTAAGLSRAATAQQTEETSGQDRSRAARATTRAKDLTDDELEAMFHRCSNAGRWGSDDELGTLNYVTAPKRIAAAKLVRTGEVVSIGRDISKTASKVDPHPVQHVRVSSGDALLVRTGMERMEQERGVQDIYPRAGFHAECAEWMHTREVAIYGGDCIEKLPYPSERFPSAMHMIALASMGLPILDWPSLTTLAETCSRQKRWDFLLTTAPMRLPGGTSAPVNPLCLF